jgi:uncharacterized Zn finger protein
MSRYYDDFPPYVPVAERRAKALKSAEKLKKKGEKISPIKIEGRKIAKTFWGIAWCTNLEKYSDYANRLPRGRSYVRNGSVIDLQVTPGQIMGLVAGSSLYKVNITIAQVVSEKWNNIINECSGQISSLIELLQGKFSTSVMEIITAEKKGLFPIPNEIKLSCSCPDWADMCKHVAAVLYGVGARLDHTPEELFILRGADHLELLSKAGSETNLHMDGHQDIAEDDLAALFDIDIEGSKKIEKKGKIGKVQSKSSKLEKSISVKVAKTTTQIDKLIKAKDKSKVIRKITKNMKE